MAHEVERLAVLSADVATFERARRDDGEATRAILAERRETMARVVVEHGGRVRPTAEDGALIATLPDTTDAVRAALDIQEHMVRHNGGLPAGQRIEHGIGVDHGEVTLEDERPSGPVLDVAVALQSIARPGTVLVSRAVFQQIKSRMHFVYRILGDRRFADLPYLVEVYQIKKVARPGRRFDPAVWLRRPTFAAAAAALLLLLVGGVWYGYERLGPGSGSQPVPTPAETGAASSPDDGEPARDSGSTADTARAGSEQAPASVRPPDERQAAPPAETESAAEATAMDEPREAAADRGPPTIAVLPLGNASGDAEDAYFSAGLTESLIRDLGRFPHLAVIAAETMFTYRDAAADPVAVAREVGAGYVVEGNATHADGELTIEARLLDAGTGEPVWQDAFQARSNDPSAVQRELTQRVLATLEGRDPAQLEDGGPGDYGTRSLQAYDYGLRWRDLFNRFEREDNQRARQAALRAIELDPNYAAAYAYVAWTYLADYWWGWATNRQATLDQALDWANKAVRRDPDEFNAHWALGDARQAMGRFEDALEAYEMALATNPNAASLMQDVGTWMMPIMGRAEAGVELVKKAMRLNPRHPEAYYGNLAFNYYLLERYDDAIEAVNRMQDPRFDQLLYLAASYAQQGQLQEAQLVITTVLADHPDLTVGSFLQTLPLQREADREHLRTGLQKAGLPLERS